MWNQDLNKTVMKWTCKRNVYLFTKQSPWETIENQINVDASSYLSKLINKHQFFSTQTRKVKMLIDFFVENIFLNFRVT